MSIIWANIWVGYLVLELSGMDMGKERAIYWWDWESRDTRSKLKTQDTSIAQMKLNIQVAVDSAWVFGDHPTLPGTGIFQDQLH